MNTSSAMFKQALTPLEKRWQGRKALKTLWLTASTGLGLTCLLLIAARLRPILLQDNLLIMGLAFSLLLIGIGQLFVWFKPPSLFKLASLGDRYLGLDERLITSLELLEGRLQTSLTIQQAQLNDSFSRLRYAPINDAFPLTNRRRFPWAIGLTTLLIATLVALYLVPNPQETILEHQADLIDLLETEIAELEQIQSDLLSTTEQVDSAEIEEISDTLADLIERLEEAKANASPEEALAALSEAEQTLSSLDEERLAEQQAAEQAAQNMAESLAESGLSEAQEAAEALENGEFEQAAESLQQAAENAASDPAQAEDLAQALENAAADVADTNPELSENLQQAAEALESGDAESLQEALEQAAEQLGEAGDQAQAQEQLEDALSNIEEARDQLAEGGQGPTVERTITEGQGQPGDAEVGDGRQNGSGRGDPGEADDGLFSAEGTDGVISTDNGPNENRLEEYSSIYAPDHIGGEGGSFVVPPEQGGDGEGFDIAETAPNPDREAGDATVPYTQVYQEYAEEAGTALDSEYIPLGLKDYVRQYFGALEPDE